MLIKCQNCNHPLISTSHFLIKGIPKEGIQCTQCSWQYRANVLVLIIPWVIGGLVFMLLNATSPSPVSYFVLPAIVLPLMIIFALKCPLIAINAPITHKKPIRWYSSPILYVGIVFCVVLFFMFR